MEGAVLRTPSPLASTGTSGSVGPGSVFFPQSCQDCQAWGQCQAGGSCSGAIILGSPIFSVAGVRRGGGGGGEKSLNGREAPIRDTKNLLGGSPARRSPRATGAGWGCAGVSAAGV